MNVLRKHVRTIVLVICLAGIFFILGFFQKYHLPRIKNWLLVQAEEVSRKHSPIRMFAKDVELHLLPIGVSFHKVRLQPQGELGENLAVKELDELGLYLSFLGFLRGRLELGEIHLRGTDITYFAKVDSIETQKPHIDFKKLSDLPIRSLKLEDIKAAVRLDRQQLAFRVDDLDLTASIRSNGLISEISAKGLRLKKSDDPAIFQMNIDAIVSANDSEISLTRLRVQKDDSFLLTSGWAEWTPKTLQIQRIVGRARASLHMPDVSTFLGEIFPDRKLPKFQGRLTFEAQTDHTIGSKLSGGFEATTKDLRVDRFLVGDLETQGLWSEQKLTFNRFVLDHPGGNLRLEGLEFTHQRPIQVAAKVVGRSVDIHKLLKGLGVNNVPVYSDLEPDLRCQTRLIPFDRLHCQGRVGVKSIKVDTNAKDSRAIVALTDGAVVGEVTVDPQGVKYSARIELPNSEGKSDGKIIYKKGFDLNFSSDKLDLDGVKEIAGIPVGGEIKIAGKTAGNRTSAGFTAKVSSDDFYLDNFRLAKIQAMAQYRAGHLRFQNIQGEYRTTKYNGDVDLNLRQRSIAITAASPFLDLLHLQELTESKWPLPIELTGTGEAQVKVEGPLNSKALNFDVRAKAFRGLIGKESYDQVQFDIVSNKGRIETRNVWVTKGPGRLSLNGQGQIGGELDGTIEGTNLRLEQSETLASLGLKFAGRLGLKTTLSGQWNDPDISGRGELADVVLGDQAVEKSQFEFTLNKDVWNGSAVFGDKVAEFYWNLGLKQQAPVNLTAKFRNWDFSQVFSVFSRSLRTEIYSANLNGEMKLRGNLGQMDKAEAQVRIEDLYVKADEHVLRNDGQMLLQLSNGQAEAKNFEIKGKDSHLRLTTRPGKSSKLNMLLDGRLDLKILGLLTPFLDDIRGALNLNLAITGQLSQPELSGSAFIESGFIRARDFPHPLEQASADIVFDNKKLVINSVRGRLAGGSVNATGQLSFTGIRELPIDIRGQFLDASFQVPPGFSTRGSGGFSVKGNWFPYTLQLDYDIVSGSVDKELKAGAKDQKEIKPSAYLPKFLVESRFSPITLDFDISLPQDFPVKLRVTRLDIDAKISGQLDIAGPPENLLLDGRIRVGRGGRVTFRENIFEIQSGIVEYRNSPPANPTLNISAESRVRANVAEGEEKDFDVHLRVLGTAADPRVTVSSQPALSEAELLSLLTLGFITQTDQSTDAEGGTSLTNTSYQLGSAFINEQLGLNRELGKRLGVEFDFSSAFSSEDQAAVHTFTVKKQWTPKFGTSASRSVGKTNTNNVRAEYRINNNFSVIGNYEGREQVGATDTTVTDEEANLFGLDFEYKVDFK